VLKLIAPLRESRQAEILIKSELPIIYCDRQSMIKVLTNLLTNSIKFTPQDRKPNIEISCRVFDDEYQFSIRDNGIGIDAKYQEKIFGLFYRINELKMVDGAGMGLSIVHKIILVHNGKIRVESRAGEGCNIIFSLPASQPAKE
jgi:signal transduction histidine kinase